MRAIENVLTDFVNWYDSLPIESKQYSIDFISKVVGRYPRPTTNLDGYYYLLEQKIQESDINPFAELEQSITKKVKELADKYNTPVKPYFVIMNLIDTEDHYLAVDSLEFDHILAKFFRTELLKKNVIFYFEPRPLMPEDQKNKEWKRVYHPLDEDKGLLQYHTHPEFEAYFYPNSHRGVRAFSFFVKPIYEKNGEKKFVLNREIHLKKELLGTEALTRFLETIYGL